MKKETVKTKKTSAEIQHVIMEKKAKIKMILKKNWKKSKKNYFSTKNVQIDIEFSLNLWYYDLCVNYECYGGQSWDINFVFLMSIYVYSVKIFRT